MKKGKWIPFIIPLLVLIIWYIATEFAWVDTKLFPSPVAVLTAFFKLALSGELLAHTWASSQRAFTGLVIGVAIGMFFGLLNGLYPIAEKFLDSTLQMIRNIPHLALIPVVIIWFGIGEEGKIFLVVVGVFFPVYVNAFYGIRSIDKGLIEMAKVYGLKGWTLFAKVVLPGALPATLVGVRQSLGIMWLTLIVSETVAVDSGIGYMAMNARDFMQMDVIILSIMIYAALGKLSDLIAKAFEKRLLSWRA
ncbi:ABC transporter permease subunit [Brevibacillus panacihumi]|uniref:ABC transporter permease subunit n=1 Tax=Brevibacillus panacihumi TaxID=497735 RepID=A0A3M8CST3_9BACL|nr:ABC transporter permease subunit [Brevibacillus panacihumi]RNB77905.1 ABC transporter permease subunit [Brevibacillus panacihumi]